MGIGGALTILVQEPFTLLENNTFHKYHDFQTY
jgi:hypothetical protein